MNRLLRLLLLALPAGAASAAGLVPDFSTNDRYVTSPTMLVRAGANGEIREIWSGMDARRMRHVPLFLETSIAGAIRDGDGWLDLRSLAYHNVGTRPGYIHIVSDDGLVSIEISAVTQAELSPVFVRYAFSRPVDLQLSATFKYPDFIRNIHADDHAGTAEFTTQWRDQNAALTTMAGPELILATLPAGDTVSLDKNLYAKRINSTRGLVLCIDATERFLVRRASGTYVEAWEDLLGGFHDVDDVAAGLVSIETGNKKLDRLFQCSIDAVASHQFASGDVMADVFFYRDSWLRDGSYTMIGLSLAGDHRDVDRYFRFWSSQRDFSVGGEREAQQPAIGITSMWLASRVSPDGTALLGKVWPYVKFYGDYYAQRIAKEGMLNVAEEWICFIPSPASWPNAEVYSGLRAAAKIARKMGHLDDAAHWDASADVLKDVFSKQAYDAGKGRFIPMAGVAGQSFTDPEYPKAENRNGPLRDDRVDSGMLIMGRLEAFGRNQGIVAVDDPRFASTRAEITRDLENPDHAMFRFGANPASPHAPQGELDCWPIAGSWAAQDEWLLGRTDLAWRYLLSGIVGKRHFDLEQASYYLPENWDRKGATDKPLIVWSHGEFITSTLLLFLGLDLEPEGADLGIAPSLPPGMDEAKVNRFHFRGWQLDFRLERRGALVDVTMEPTNTEGGSLVVRLPFGRTLSLRSGETQRFTVEPARYYEAFGRSGNAAERAGVMSRVLLGKDPPRDTQKMTPAELEAFMVATESAYAPANE
jgi:GH15 family glucan-1,4-alpha-glucosidase